MSFLDEAKNLANQAEKLAKEHPDQVKKALDAVEHEANTATGGKHSSQLESAETKADEFLTKK